MNFEFLECRLLLTGAYTTYDAGAKKLTVTTPSTNDVIVISLSAGHTMSVSVGGVNDYNLAGANSAAVLALIEVQAGSGNDSVNLGATSSPILTPTLINGGNGADTIIGGAGADQIYGGAGNDSIDGNLGADSISGGTDNDTVSYATRATAVSVNLDLLANDGAAGEGDWVGFGTTDVESVMGGSGNDTLTGDALGNYISGGAGADMIHGMDGSDTEVGGAGGDSLYGDNGPDFIFAKDGEFDVIDGGPDIDAADVDTSPVEAPLPGALPTDAVTSTENSAPVASTVPVMGPVAKAPAISSVFSTRRVRRRQASIAKIFQAANATPAPLPAPPPDDNTEGKIDAATLQSIIQPLDPYCIGQVLTTRDAQGPVHTDGTAGDDQFIVQTTPGVAGVSVTNNGGLTVWPLASPTIFVNGSGGTADGLTVMGTNVSYNPGGQGSPATILSDGHLIILNGIDPHQISFSDVGNLTVVTPGSVDFLHMGTIGTTSSVELDGQSDGNDIGLISLDNVQLLTLDTGKNDNAANPNDSLVVDNIPGGGPHVALMPGAFGSDVVTVNQPGFVLVNDPTATPGQPTVTLNVNPQGDVSFAGPITRLAHMNLAGHASIIAGGDKSLHPGGVNVLGGTLDINDNSLVIDSANGVFQQSGGTTNLGGGTLVAPNVNLQGGVLAGNGAITGNLLNAATVSPGFSAGKISVSDDYTQTPTGALTIEIGGTTPGTEFDQLSVGGTATLGGTLNVSLINGFVPGSSDQFSIMPYVTHQGDFANKNGLSFTGGVFTTKTLPLKYLLDANLAPTAAADSATTVEDKPVNINVLANDSDPDDTDANPDVDPPTIDSFTQPSHGAVATNAGGGFTYSPGADFNGTDTFTYTLRDAANNTATATVTVSVTPVNDAPQFVLSKPAFNVNENSGAQSVGIIGGAPNAPRPGPITAVDEANQTLTFDVQVSNVTGNLAFDSAPAIDPQTGKLTFTASPDTHGSATLSIRLKDDGGTANGGVDTSDAQVFKLTVNAVPPTVLNAAYVHQNPANNFAGNFLRVHFSEPVSLTLADISVLNVDTNQAIVPTSLQYVAGNNAAIITLPGTPADGNYVLTLAAPNIKDAGGTSLDGDGDGLSGGDFNFGFFQLRGDVDLDRKVGFSDLVAVAQHYGGSNALYADGDVTGDGRVGFADLVAVAQNYGKTLNPPGPPTPAVPV